jgi:hypothetical protein
LQCKTLSLIDTDETWKEDPKDEFNSGDKADGRRLGNLPRISADGRRLEKENRDRKQIFTPDNTDDSESYFSLFEKLKERDVAMLRLYVENISQVQSAVPLREYGSIRAKTFEHRGTKGAGEQMESQPCHPAKIHRSHWLKTTNPPTNLTLRFLKLSESGAYAVRRLA